VRVKRERRGGASVAIAIAAGLLTVAGSFGLLFYAGLLGLGLGMTCENQCTEANTIWGLSVGHTVVQITAFLGLLWWSTGTGNWRPRMQWAVCIGYVALNAALLALVANRVWRGDWL
jgi:hypothetical protein